MSSNENEATLSATSAQPINLLSIVSTIAAILLPIIILLRLFQRVSSLYTKKTPSLSKEYRSYPIVKREIVSEGTDDQTRPVMFLTLGMKTGAIPTGSHVKIRQTIAGKVEQRSYTPTRFHEDQCELLLRIYPTGKVTQALYNLKVGDTVDVRGPTGQIRYEGPGVFSKGKKKLSGIQHIVCIAGGTGITPCLQITNHVLQDTNDNTHVHILDFNTTFADCMMNDTLTELATQSDGQLTFSFVVSKSSIGDPSNIKNASMRTIEPATLIQLLGIHMNTEFQLDQDTTVVCVCGPPGFVKATKSLMKKAGVDENCILVF